MSAKSFQSCPTLCNPTDCSPPGPSTHGIFQARVLEWVAISFSRRKYRKKESEVTQSCPTLYDPKDCSPPGSSIHEILQARILERVAISSPGDHANPRIKPRSPALWADSLPAELPEKFKNTGVGSLSLLRGIFPTQESNQGLLHCRQILYQLSCPGSSNQVIHNLKW